MSSIIDNPSNRSVLRDFRNNNINNVTTNRIPFYPTVSLPPPTFANKGQIVYDTTTNEFCYCNGTVWVCISASSVSRAGIVDCTVGSAANPNADYNSVQEALDAGCLFIRILDGLVGGQVPGYFEPGPIDFSAVGSPTMVYIDPGVDWTLRQSAVGTGGIIMTGSLVTFRGSGFGSIVAQVQDGGVAGSVFAMDDSTLSQWMDLTFTTSAAASAFPNPMGRLIMRNSQYVVVDTNAGTAYSINTVANSAGNRVEFHECTFIGFDITTRMLDNTAAGDNGFLTLTNCVHEGSGIAPTVGSAYRFATVGGHPTVNGFEFHNSATLTITLGGPDGSSFDGIYENVADLSIIMDGTRHFNNGRVNTLVFTSGFNNIANVTVIGAGLVDISGGDNNITGCDFTNLVSVTGSNSTLEGCTFRSGLTVTTAGATILDNINISDANILVSDMIVEPAVGGTVFKSNFSNINITSTGRLRVADTGNLVNACNFTDVNVGDSTGFSSPNIFLGNCDNCNFTNMHTFTTAELGNPAQTVPGPAFCNFSGVYFALLDINSTNRNQFSSCVSLSAGGIDLATGAFQQIFSSCFFQVPVVVNSGNSQTQFTNCQGFGSWTIAGDFCSLTGCNIGSGIGPSLTVSGDRCRMVNSSIDGIVLNGDEHVVNGCMFTDTVTIGSLASTDNIKVNGNQFDTTVTINPAAGNADAGVYTGNHFVVIPVITVAPATGPLFVGNTNAGGLGGPAGANAASGNNT